MSSTMDKLVRLPEAQRRAMLDAACGVVMAYAAATRGAHSRDSAEQRVRMTAVDTAVGDIAVNPALPTYFRRLPKRELLAACLEIVQANIMSWYG